jgi:hypothetical protein
MPVAGSSIPSIFNLKSEVSKLDAVNLQSEIFNLKSEMLNVLLQVFSIASPGCVL